MTMISQGMLNNLLCGKLHVDGTMFSGMLSAMSPKFWVFRLRIQKVSLKKSNKAAISNMKPFQTGCQLNKPLKNPTLIHHSIGALRSPIGQADLVPLSCGLGLQGQPLACCHKGQWRLLGGPCQAFQTSERCRCTAHSWHVRGSSFIIL